MIICILIVKLIDYLTDKDFDGLLLIPIIICVMLLFSFIKDFGMEYQIAKASEIEDSNSTVGKATKTKINKRVKFSRYRVKYFAGIILVVLIILNPSSSRFKEFIGGNKSVSESNNLRRDYNFIVFSIFSDENIEEGATTKYIGILGNFIQI